MRIERALTVAQSEPAARPEPAAQPEPVEPRAPITLREAAAARTEMGALETELDPKNQGRS